MSAAPGPAGPPPQLLEAAAHVFVDDLDDPLLSDEDAHHLRRVLRLRDGEVVTVSDGAGRWRPCTLSQGTLEPTGPVVTAAAPLPAISVAFALPKGDRPELVVQKLTEIGADVIIPMVTERSVVRWDPERAAKHGARLARVAREAAMQSRRTRLPVVEALSPFASVVGRVGAALAAPGGAWPRTATPLILVGPEGGWSPAELAAARATVGLGDLVLRTETAAIMACTLLVAERARSVEA
ncbi:MAG: 16S rRNA (uracil(1498)-N(3))-methyltransferase [Acidimicrobiia bacterium]